MNDVIIGSKFKKDFKRVKARGYKVEKLKQVIELLKNDEPLPKNMADHKLWDSKTYYNEKECHIEPDWLLIYRVEDGVVTLIRTGTHSDLY